MKYDLHSHSDASDGALSPESLIRRAVERGVDVLALTDHDSTEGIASARQAAAAQGIRFVAGVEISVTWSKRTIHILGLGVDSDNGALQTGLQGLRKFRTWRAGEIGRRLAKAGIADALQGASRYASGSVISRTHFARFLVDGGYAKDVREVFKHYLVNNKPGYVPGNWADLESAVGWIREAGGQAVIAHPARYKLSATKMRCLLAEFCEVGGEGLEVVSSSHSANDSRNMAQLANQFGLLASCGSDFHSPEQHWAELGRIPPLPPQCTPLWDQWTQSRKTDLLS